MGQMEKQKTGNRMGTGTRTKTGDRLLKLHGQRQLRVHSYLPHKYNMGKLWTLILFTSITKKKWAIVQQFINSVHSQR